MSDAILSDDDVGLGQTGQSPVLADADVGLEQQSSFFDRQAPIKGASQEAVKGVGSIAKGLSALSYFVPPDADIEPGVFVPREVQQQRIEYQGRLKLSNAEQLRQIQTGSLYQFGKSIQEAAEEAYPLTEEEKKGIATKIGKALGGFIPMAATGPLAPATIGLQSIGEGLDANYQIAINKGKSPDEAAQSAINRSMASGAVQAVLFAILPAQLKKAGDKGLIDKFGRGVLSRFLLKRVAQAGEGAALGATSKVAENVIQGEPVTKDVGSSAAGLGVMQAFFPRGRTPDEELFQPPPGGTPDNYFTPPERQNITGPTEPYVPPEPGPIGVIPPGGTVPVPTRKRIVLPTDLLRKGVPNAIQIGSAAPVPVENSSQDSGSVESRAVVQNGPEGIPAEKQGTAVPQEKGKEEAPNLPDVTRAKLFTNMQGRTMILQPGAFDTADAHLKLVLGQGAPSWKQLAASGVVDATPTENGGMAVKLKFQEAPVRFLSVQKGLPAKGIPDIELYNLTEAIPGFGQGSTVGRPELERLGYTIPAAEDPSVKPALKLEAPESVEAQKAREAEEAKAKAAKDAEQKAKAEVAAKAAERKGGDLGSAGQGGLFAEPGQQEIFQPKPAEKPIEDSEAIDSVMTSAQQMKMARFPETEVRKFVEDALTTGKFTDAEKGDARQTMDTWFPQRPDPKTFKEGGRIELSGGGKFHSDISGKIYQVLNDGRALDVIKDGTDFPVRVTVEDYKNVKFGPAEEKPVEPKITEAQSEIISAVQKYRIGASPQTYSLVERLAQSASEKELGEQPVKIKNDKTGEVQVVLEQDLTPVKARTAEERAASRALTAKELDDLIRKEGLDPKEFPDKAAKREILKRKGKLSNREIAEGIAEKLEQKKIKGKPDELLATLFPGLDSSTVRAVWNTALDLAQNAIRAGATIADGIERAVEYIRANVKSQWDEAAVRRELETSMGALGETDRHQVAGVRNLGAEYEPETIRSIQSRLRVGYFDATQPVEAARTQTAWDLANQMTDPVGRGRFSTEVMENGGGNMAPGLLVKELWDYAVKMAAGKDDSLLRFIVNKYADFETVAGGGNTSKASQVMRSARELAANPLWRALVKMEREAASMADRRLAVGPELFNDIISRVNEISLTAEEIDNVLREGRDSQGRTLQEILDAASPERAAARDSLERYSPQVKSTALETVYEWLKQNTEADETTFKDSLTKALVDLNNVDLDEATARQIAEGTWTRKNTLETNRRRSAWNRVLKELDERAQRTAQAYVNRLETSQVEWQRNPERKNEALKVIREALDPNTPLPAQVPSLFTIPLRDRLMALGVTRDIATRLVNKIYEKRLAEWASAHTRAMEQAADSGSVKSLVEALRSSSYRAQKDPAWRQRTAEDWFMSNGLSRDQAVTAAKLFSDKFEVALQKAAEKLATQLLDGKQPRTIADVIKAIRAGLTDPNRNWVEDIAALNGWKNLTAEQHAQLAEIDAKLSDPELSLPEQSELFDQMNSIVQRSGDGSKRWKYAIGELFAANKLSGTKTFSLHIFQPITAFLFRDLPVAAIFQTRDVPTLIRAYVEAAKNFFPELKYAWQKDVYYLSQSKMISYHNELRNQMEDGIKALKAGNVKGSLKLTYAWGQYFLRGLQSANQANQAILREWKLALYGSQAMRDAGMSTEEISHLVDAVSGMKQSFYEDGLSKGMSKAAAYARADDLAFNKMREYFGETIPGDTKSIADDILRAAENDQYSAVGRLAPQPGDRTSLGKSGEEEGWASWPINKFVLRPSSELRKEGGFKSVFGMTLFGFVNIPLRSAKYLSNYTAYGFVRYGRWKYGQSHNLENPWKQSFGTELQAKQRLREAVVGTAVGALALGLFHTTADPDKDKRKFGIYVSGAWKGINSRVERDALDKLGFKPLSLHVVIDGKVRSSIPMTRTAHALGFLFGPSAIADDIAWKNKEAAVTGAHVPVSADVMSALGTMYYIVGQQGILQSVSHFQTLAQGSVGGSAIEKSIADAASSLVGGFIPGQVLLQNISEMIKGPLDKSSIQSDVAANLPIVGAYWQKQAINRLGDPLYDQTWYGKSLRLGAPIAFKVAQNKENEQIYGMMVDKGVAPPDLRRYIIEEKYGPISDDQWSKFAKLSGNLLKQQIVGNLSTLQSQDPADVKKFLNKAGTTANSDAASSIGLETQPKPSKVSTEPSAAVSTPNILSGRSAGPAALRGAPKSTGVKRLRRIGLKAASGGGARGIRIAKLRKGGRRLASGRRRVAGARIAAGYSSKFRKRRIVTV